MLWIALHPFRSFEPPRHWALAYTPRVCPFEDALLLEAAASQRLYRGRRRLLNAVWRTAQQHGHTTMAVAHTAHAALALLRSVPDTGSGTVALHLRDPQHQLDLLPLHTLSAWRPHLATAHALGCHTLGHVRQLPRSGVAQRFGPDALMALDRTYGLQPETIVWPELPEIFDVALELPGRIDHAEGLVFATRRLLRQLVLWLQERQSGVTQLQLVWSHDRLRRQGTAEGVLEWRTAAPTRDAAHLERVLAERLARTTLEAPVLGLRLRALGVEALHTQTANLLDPTARGQSDAHATGATALTQTLEKLCARLGTGQVLRGSLQAQHHPEQMQRWEEATKEPLPGAGKAGKPVGTPAGTPFRSKASARPSSSQLSAQPGTHALLPGWLLPQPLPLSTQPPDTPCYHGPLQLLGRPHRVETSWWQCAEKREGEDEGEDEDEGHAKEKAPAAPGCIQRDYFVAESPRAGLVWVFRERQVAASHLGTPPPGTPPSEASRWFLHGIYG
jgi:protein ImuB